MSALNTSPELEKRIPPFFLSLKRERLNSGTHTHTGCRTVFKRPVGYVWTGEMPLDSELVVYREHTIFYVHKILREIFLLLSKAG